MRYCLYSSQVSTKFVCKITEKIYFPRLSPRDLDFKPTPEIYSRSSHYGDGIAQLVEHWTAIPIWWPEFDPPWGLYCPTSCVQFSPAGLSVFNCRYIGKWCGTLKAARNTDHTRQTWIHKQTPLSPLVVCGPVCEGTSGKVLIWTVRSLNHHQQVVPLSRTID